MAEINPPHFLIIGAMKTGTTSLYSYLTGVPGAARASKKELQYFSFLHSRPLEWYLSQFPRGAITGEASPQYLFHPRAAERCAAVLPDVRLIALLRNPIDRAYSHYQFEVNRGREALGTFEEALDAEDDRLSTVTRGDYDTRGNLASRYSYRTRGLYADQLERWLKFYPHEQIRIVETSEFEADPQGVVSGLAKWLGLREPARRSFVHENVGSYSSPMAEATREQLRVYFAPHNERLYRMLGRDFGWH